MALVAVFLGVAAVAVVAARRVQLHLMALEALVGYMVAAVAVPPVLDLLAEQLAVEAVKA
jgi:hypothetical protein